jgi:hypothetical protein
MTTSARHTWTPSDDALLRAQYATTPACILAERIGVSPSAVKARIKALGLRKRMLWTPGDVDTLRRLYPTHSATECAEVLGMAECSVVNKASQLGLVKSIEWIRERARAVMQNPDHPGRQHQFQKGLTPWNKGIPFDSGGASINTRFQPGSKPHSWRPIGHTRTRSDGYVERKTADTGCTRRDYVLIHHLVWRMHGGTVPPGQALVFRDGDKRNVDIHNLELVHRADLMRRNSVHRHEPEIGAAYQLLGAIKRQINRKTQEIAP